MRKGREGRTMVQSCCVHCLLTSHTLKGIVPLGGQSYSTSSNHTNKTTDPCFCTMTKPILGYWKIRGLAAGIRYQLAYSKVDFDEDVYEQGDGPDFRLVSCTVHVVDTKSCAFVEVQSCASL